MLVAELQKKYTLILSVTSYASSKYQFGIITRFGSRNSLSNLFTVAARMFYSIVSLCFVRQLKLGAR